MDEKAFALLLDSKLSGVDEKQRSKIKKLATDAFKASLVDMSEEKLRAAVEAFVKAVTAPEGEADEEEEEEKKPEDEEDDPEKKKEEATDSKKRKAADSKGDDDLAAGEALVKQIADSQSQTLSLIDTREKVRGMVADSYDFEGKSVRQLHLDAIAAVNPEVRKALGDKASDEKIAGAFETLRASRSSWIKTDSKPERKGEHVARYEQRMSDAFDKSWGGK